MKKTILLQIFWTWKNAGVWNISIMVLSDLEKINLIWSFYPQVNKYLADKCWVLAPGGILSQSCQKIPGVGLFVATEVLQATSFINITDWSFFVAETLCGSSNLCLSPASALYSRPYKEAQI